LGDICKPYLFSLLLTGEATALGGSGSLKEESCDEGKTCLNAGCGCGDKIMLISRKQDMGG